jgi:hypothetical protein
MVGKIIFSFFWKAITIAIVITLVITVILWKCFRKSKKVINSKSETSFPASQLGEHQSGLQFYSNFKVEEKAPKKLDIPPLSNDEYKTLQLEAYNNCGIEIDKRKKAEAENQVLKVQLQRLKKQFSPEHEELVELRSEVEELTSFKSQYEKEKKKKQQWEAKFQGLSKVLQENKEAKKLFEEKEYLDGGPSYGSRDVYKFLTKTLDITPNKEFKIQDSRVKSRKYDYHFLYDSLHFILEFDGKPHFEFTKKYHASLEVLEESKQVDRLKTKVAIENGFRMIRISYKQEKEIDYHILQALKQKKKLYLSDPLLYQSIGIQ